MSIDLWSDEISAFVDAGFATVSRNPSDHETAVAYRTAIALALTSGMEAATAGETCNRLDPKGDSPTAESGDAQNQSGTPE